LVTNPVTFAPVYYAAWQLGSFVLGKPGEPAELPAAVPPLVAVPGEGWWRRALHRVLGVGKPLLLSLR
jgi:hypothetical protein